MLTDMGYSEMEMCSPIGYSDVGFEPLNKNSGKDMRTIIEDASLVHRSSQYIMPELRDHLDNRIEWSKQIGISQIIASSFWLPKDASIDGFRRAANELNAIGEKIKTAGIQVGFHNHHMEFEKRGNELIYDALLEEFDPELVKMQFQMAVINKGIKAADYFRKYPGRFISSHLADWSPEKKANVPIGQGIVDWKDFFEASKTGGVEMDETTFKPNAKYLAGM